MKKILIVFTALLMFVSCGPYHSSENDKTYTANDICCDILEFEYKNHSYILFRRGFTERSIGGAVHNPDCKCFKKVSYE